MSPAQELRSDDLPGPGASTAAVLQFASKLNGYEAVGGDASALGTYVSRLEERGPSELSVHDLRILLFAKQRAHYYSGGGRAGHDPIMDEMRAIVELIRGRLEDLP